MNLRGIVVCVSYDDLASITFARNVRHFAELIVVTAPHDVKTQELCRKFDNVIPFVTDAFYRHSARFNKGLAIELATKEHCRDGWNLIHDADIILPADFSLPPLNIGTLYGARRRILENPLLYREWLKWQTLPISNDKELAGYFQLFHASDPHIAARPWYDVTFTHAGGGDAYFQNRWLDADKRWLTQEVLHLGPRDSNWFGRATPRIDGQETPEAAKHRADMEAFLRFKGWNRKRTVKEFAERVDVRD
jgi:hypothetical protein